MRDSKTSKALFITLLTCFLGSFAGLSAPTVFTVPGTANIFGAGHAFAPDPGGGGGGTPPVEIDLPLGTSRVSFPSVTGQINTATGSALNTEQPDGAVGTGYDIASYGGISGLIDADRGGFLAGVFLNANEPTDPAPARLAFSDATIGFESLAPLLNQTFFIGDGLTGTGAGDLQTFYVPAGATHLYLGILDAYGWNGLPGYYGDNGGEFNVSVQLVSIPEPTTLSLLILGCAASLISEPKNRR